MRWLGTKRAGSDIGMAPVEADTASTAVPEVPAESPREQATVWVVARELVMEDGSFARGRCLRCDWKGPGRRARSRAQQDAETHAQTHGQIA